MGADFKKLLVLKFVFFLVLNCSSAKKISLSVENVNNSLSNNSQRESKLLPFLALVSFSQSLCSSGGVNNGVCLKKSTCTSMQGNVGDSCAQGFGVCCTIPRKCTSDPVIITSSGSQLLPGSSFESLCRYEIQKQKGISQVRLDFVAFSIAGPSLDQNNIGPSTGTGNCDSDSMTISGQTNGKLGDICGNLDGQHMYLDFGSNDRITLNIYLAMSSNQNWNILVTLIKSNTPQEAPDGCLQYYTDQRAMVKSFNYGASTGQHLNNEDYSVCVKSNSGMTRILWKQCTGANDVFQVTGDSAISPDIPQTGSDCALDWVQVYGADKYCGTQFTDALSTTQPFLMQVHFNEWELPPSQDVNGNPPADFENRGFCLMYAQMP